QGDDLYYLVTTWNAYNVFLVRTRLSEINSPVSARAVGPEVSATSEVVREVPVSELVDGRVPTACPPGRLAQGRRRVPAEPSEAGAAVGALPLPRLLAVSRLEDVPVLRPRLGVGADHLRHQQRQMMFRVLLCADRHLERPGRVAPVEDGQFDRPVAHVAGPRERVERGLHRVRVPDRHLEIHDVRGVEAVHRGGADVVDPLRRVARTCPSLAIARLASAAHSGRNGTTSREPTTGVGVRRLRSTGRRRRSTRSRPSPRTGSRRPELSTSTSATSCRASSVAWRDIRALASSSDIPRWDTRRSRRTSAGVSTTITRW